MRAIDGDIPLSVVLAIDKSGSMAGLNIDQAKQAATSMVGSLGEQDTASLLSFSDAVTVGPVASVDRETLTLAIAELSARGNTALYDATTAAADLAVSSGGARNAVVLLSDGEDFSGRSLATRAASLEQAAASEAIFYVIGVGAEIDRDYLTTLADTAGGRLFEAVSPAETPTIYQSLEDLLRRQYIVTFTNQAAAKTQSQQVEIRIQVGELNGSASRDYLSRREAPVAPAVTVPEPAVPAATPVLTAPVESPPPVVEDVVEEVAVVPAAVPVVEDSSSSFPTLWVALIGTVLVVAAGAFALRARRGREDERSDPPISARPLNLSPKEPTFLSNSSGSLR